MDNGKLYLSTNKSEIMLSKYCNRLIKCVNKYNANNHK